MNRTIKGIGLFAYHLTVLIVGGMAIQLLLVLLVGMLTGALWGML